MTCGGSPVVDAQATNEGPWAEGVGTDAGDQPAPTPIENEFVRAANGHFQVGGGLFRHVGVNIAGARGIRLTVAFTNFYRARYFANEARGGESLVAGDEGFYTDVCCGGVNIQNHEWPEGGFRKHYKPFVEAIVDRFKNDGRIFARAARPPLLLFHRVPL